MVSPWTRSISFVGLGPLQDRTTSLIASTARASKTPPGLVHRTNLLGPEYGFGNDFVLLDETYLGAYDRVRQAIYRLFRSGANFGDLRLAALLFGPCGAGRWVPGPTYETSDAASDLRA